MENLPNDKMKPEEILSQNPEAVKNESEEAAAASLPLESCSSNCILRKVFSKPTSDTLSEGVFPPKPLNRDPKSNDIKPLTKNGIENNNSGKAGQADTVKENYPNCSLPTTDETSANISDTINFTSGRKDIPKSDEQNLTSTLRKTTAEGESPIQQNASSAEKKDAENSQTHYSYLSICLTNSNNSARTPSSNREPLPRRNVPTSRYPDEAPLRNLNQRPVSQSRPSSPPPATYFPSPRRPSLSLPPSPQSSRVHRASLPANAFASFNLSNLRGGSSSTHSSPSNSRARTPTPPPINRRSPRRRSARTPSPRPPLPPQATNGPPAQPQQPPSNRNRQECQPYKMKMRSR
ncbi:hypothetical protein Avbf_11164 [Armadillidium vulgare]|nr:hypothetical protein Avbf_11164 [Armadillidium vulgare]